LSFESDQPSRRGSFGFVKFFFVPLELEGNSYPFRSVKEIRSYPSAPTRTYPIRAPSSDKRGNGDEGEETRLSERDEKNGIDIDKRGVVGYWNEQVATA